MHGGVARAKPSSRISSDADDDSAETLQLSAHVLAAIDEKRRQKGYPVMTTAEVCTGERAQ